MLLEFRVAKTTFLPLRLLGEVKFEGRNESIHNENTLETLTNLKAIYVLY